MSGNTQKEIIACEKTGDLEDTPIFVGEKRPREKRRSSSSKKKRTDTKERMMLSRKYECQGSDRSACEPRRLELRPKLERRKSPSHRKNKRRRGKRGPTAGGRSGLFGRYAEERGRSVLVLKSVRQTINDSPKTSASLKSSWKRTRSTLEKWQSILTGGFLRGQGGGGFVPSKKQEKDPRKGRGRRGRWERVKRSYVGVSTSRGKSITYRKRIQGRGRGETRSRRRAKQSSQKKRQGGPDVARKRRANAAKEGGKNLINPEKAGGESATVL